MIKLEKIRTDKPHKISTVTNAIIKKGFSPYIKDGYWYEYDEETKTFINTGVIAEGKNGLDGRDGRNGIDGYTPVKGIDYRDGIDGKDGINGVNGRDGVDGKNGIDGKDGKDGTNGKDGINGIDGKTPVKGVDYWTDADKQDIINTILTNVPYAEEAEF